MNPTFHSNNNTIIAIAGGESSGGADTLAYTIVNNDEPNVSFTGGQSMTAPSTTYNINTNGGFTAIVRVRFTDIPTSFERIFQFSDTGSNANGIILLRGGGTDLQLSVLDAVSNSYNCNGGIIVQNRWTNIVARYNLSTNIIEIIQDGVSVGTTSVPILADRTLDYNALAIDAIASTSSNLDIAGMFFYDRMLFNNEIITCFDYIQGREVYTPVIVQDIVVSPGNETFFIETTTDPFATDFFQFFGAFYFISLGTYTPVALASALTTLFATGGPPGLSTLVCTWNSSIQRFEITDTAGRYVAMYNEPLQPLNALMGFQNTNVPHQLTITAPNLPTFASDPDAPKFALIARTLGLADGANVATWSEFTQVTPANQPVFWRRFNNWVGLGNSVFSTFPHDIKYARNRWVAVGIGTNTLAYSNDGITWMGLGTGIFSSAGIGMASSSTRWVAGGSGTTNSLAYSADGISWTGLGKTVFDVCFQTAWNPKLNRWVAVGHNEPVSSAISIAYSPDGITWTITTSPFTSIGSYSAAYCVATAILPGGGTQWVAGGQSNGANTSLAYSTDGITWIGNGNGIFSAYCFGVAWNGLLWVAVGAGSTNSIATSSDGINWTPIGKPAGMDIGRRVAWTGTYWIVAGEPATGGNCLAISYDGSNWTGITRQGLFTSRGMSIGSNFPVL